MNVDLIKRNSKVKCLFLDRDGVINIDYGHVHSIDKFVFKEKIFKTLKIINNLKFKLIVITNQGGIGRGIYSAYDFHILNNYMKKKFIENSISLDDVFFCPYHPEYGIGQYKKESFFRKPNPGMLIHAINKHNINVDKSIMIGDKETDKIAASKVGIYKYIDSKDPLWDKKLLNMVFSVDNN